ncbi:Holliday junction branch migration protein RuvA [Agarivorans sp. MS3-6]|uniref:Holliday junction branch migration protein RuvA n=1 Tax=Agarivorans sp. TSD2052 TaxID=2937286 RepID=UPI00200D6B9F|nr:Holliday junction branch migration protein RuvA [Agarivorans sp. TSD2052]UPW20616.1 Holliday junction branch migration protein RuvA [Agarivorans sp. TSD2052]
MIATIKGILEDKAPPFVLIDVAGVGYEIQLPMSCFYQLPELGESVRLLTHFIVREDAQLLYGFHDNQSRSLFKELIKVNGIGPKVALAILSGLSCEQFVFAVKHEDLSSLVKVPGIGKKTAERLLVEMKDRLKNWNVELPATPISDTINANGDLPLRPTVDPKEEAIAALESLGYKIVQAEKLVKQVWIANMTSEQLIREALKAAL